MVTEHTAQWWPAVRLLPRQNQFTRTPIQSQLRAVANRSGEFRENWMNALYRGYPAYAWRIHGWWTSFRRYGVRNDLCDWFASIYVTGSQWWKGWDQSSTEKKGEYDPSLASVYVIICPWSIKKFCRTFRRDIATEKRQIVTYKVKNLGNNRNKSIISYFDENIRQWWTWGCRHLSIQLFSTHPCR